MDSDTPVLDPITPDSPTEAVQADYFGMEAVHTVYLPDKKTYIEHKELNEGARKDYLNKTNRSVRVQRATGDAIMNMAQGDDRHHLLEAAITNWNVIRNDTPFPFSARNLKDFLTFAPPHIVDIIEKDIRKHNKWLAAEITVEDIDTQLEELQELRKQKVEEEAGNATSSDK